MGQRGERERGGKREEDQVREGLGRRDGSANWGDDREGRAAQQRRHGGERERRGAGGGGRTGGSLARTARARAPSHPQRTAVYVQPRFQGARAGISATVARIPYGDVTDGLTSRLYTAARATLDQLSIRGCAASTLAISVLSHRDVDTRDRPLRPCRNDNAG